MVLGPHGVHAEAHRPVVAGRRGMVCTGHPLAAEAGVAILRRGGHAVDAAIAVAAALNVVEPHMSGVGGDGFSMVYDAEHGRIRVMNATGPAPARATREVYVAGGIPMKGMRSVSVPGLVSGWLQIHEAYGRLPLATDLAPAIELAEEGFPISYKLAQAIAGDAALRECPAARAVFTRDGRPLAPGDLLVQRDLAETLRTIAADGHDGFYRGRIARLIQYCSEDQGGLLTTDDLAAYRASWEEPISIDYRSFTVYSAPPNSSGLTLLQMLNLIEADDLAALGPNSAASVHLMVEAKRLAFADREAYLADPRYAEVPIAGLISKEYAHERRRLIDPDRAASLVAPGNPWRYQGQAPPVGRGRRPPRSTPEDTTCFAVVDGRGNAVCQLQSLQSAFGSSIVVPGTGILLNNRMTYWHLDPDHIDCLEPGKRVRHTMTPVMIFRDGRLVLVCGTPGADTQVQSNLQVITLVLDHGYLVNEAVEAPRWRHLQDGTESTVPHRCADELLLEERFPVEVQRGLTARGHPVRLIGPWEAVGSMVMIQVRPETGALFGAVDPRRDGYAVGW